MIAELHPGVLFILGISVFGGMLGAWLSQRVRFPQVVGYILIGLLIGESGLRLVQSSDIQALRPFNMFALGIIGFLVGGELKTDTFRKYAKQFTAILLGEGVGAFLLVGLSVYGLLYFVCRNHITAMAGGVVFGAIASATDPASTIDVLWEYRARGVLTTSLTAIVALDDALAMTLYGLGTSVAYMLTSGSGSLLSGLLHITIEIGGALLTGAIFAAILILLLRWLYQPEKSLAISIGLILLLISICLALEMDVILAAMALGFILANFAPRRSRQLFEMMRGFSVPIYVLFFVLVGARIALGDMPRWLIALVLIYVVGRSAGKMFGAWYGARVTHGEPVVRNYLGMGLFAQGGVAIGLSIMASQHLSNIPLHGNLSLGDTIIFAVTATTLMVQIIGPPMVKLAIKLAGETGKNITERDIIAEWKTTDVLQPDITLIPEDMPVKQVVDLFVKNDYLAYPVVHTDGTIIGMVSLNALKNVMNDQTSWQWLLASDIMEHTIETATAHNRLEDIIGRMEQLQIHYIPVVESDANRRPIGIIDLQHLHKRASDELIMRQSPA
jgi:NhaP-type Na+/H+ or K+/H+ antiporter